MYSLTSVRVTFEQRERLKQIASEDYGGVSAGEAIEQLINEHFEARCIGQMDALRQDANQWADYKTELTGWTGIQAGVIE